ncbi:MAG: XRE family transcriptional regulator [Leptolyngbya sp. PLA1]|nr:XRE family transcriptional regulator [Leptolyngbya sp. PLA1]
MSDPDDTQDTPVARPALAGTFGSLVREARLRAGLTQEALATRVGCAKSYLSVIESGHRPPPSDDVVRRLEEAMSLPEGVLRRKADLGRAILAGGEPLREELSRVQEGESVLRRLRAALRSDAPSSAKVEAMRSIVASAGGGDHSLTDAATIPLNFEVPLINKVAAGYPSDFTDLSFPARIADEYVRAPDLSDPDAFAARVCGDSMLPEYGAGDVVIFSPAVSVRSGMDCFARIEPDHQTTFKRVYFDEDAGGTLVRLQPLNPAYPATRYPRDRIAGLYAAVSVFRRIGLRG